MKPLRLIYHINCEPPAYLESYLARKAYPFEVICLNEDTDAPMDLQGLAGLVLMGGAGNVNEPTQWMDKELSVVQKAAELGLPMLGICLGAQLISKALGGVISPGETLEVGWHMVEQQPGHGQDWFSGLPSSFEVFQWHAHTFSLPHGAVALARNDCSKLQAFSLNNILAMQFHLEMTPDLIEFLISRYASDLEEESTCVQSAQAIREELSERTKALHKIADVVYGNWLGHIYSKSDMHACR